MKRGIVFQAVESIAYYLNKKEKRYSVFIFILLIISSVLDVFGLASLVPVIMAASTPDLITSNKYFAFIYNAFGFQNEKLFLIALVVAIFLFFLVKNFFTTWINYKQVQFTTKIALNIIERQFNKYTNLPFWQFNNEGSAKLITNILYIPQSFVTSIIRPVFILFSEIAIIFVIVFGIFLYQPMLFIILLLLLAPSAMLTYKMLKTKSERIGFKLNELQPPSYRILSNTFNGFVELKLSNKLEAFREDFMANKREVQELEARAYLFTLIPLKVIEMVAILGVVTIFLYALLFPKLAGNLVAIMGLFAAAAYRLMPSINRLLTSMVSIKQASVTIEELKAFQDYERGNTVQAVQKPISFKQEIRFKNLSFSFPGASKPALSNIDIVIKKGEKVGFIGTSGSGKTTLMNILLQFYKEEQGSVLVDGVPLNDLTKESWYSMIGYVKQDTFLMECSIKDNITLLDSEVDYDKLNFVLEQASLKDFVDTLPNGIDTLIGERGSKLSGGQKQRIGLARALYKNAQVLVLDEATSALDSKTELEVSEAIAKLSQTDITIFMIAHRITTLRDCNRIFEMKDGEIIAERSYKEVIQEVI